MEYRLVASEIPIAPNDRWYQMGRQYRTQLQTRITQLWWCSIVTKTSAVLLFLSGLGIIIGGFIEGSTHNFLMQYLNLVWIGCGMLGSVIICIAFIFWIRKNLNLIKHELKTAPVNLMPVLQIRSDLLSFPPKFPPTSIDLVASGILSSDIYTEYLELRASCRKLKEKGTLLSSINSEAIGQNTWYSQLRDGFNLQLQDWNDEWNRFRPSLEADLPNPIYELEV